jgi:hypothetical protein
MGTFHDVQPNWDGKVSIVKKGITWNSIKKTCPKAGLKKYGKRRLGCSAPNETPDKQGGHAGPPL